MWEETTGQVRPELCAAIRVIDQVITIVSIPASDKKSVQQAILCADIEHAVTLPDLCVDRAATDQYRGRTADTPETLRVIGRTSELVQRNTTAAAHAVQEHLCFCCRSNTQHWL